MTNTSVKEYLTRLFHSVWGKRLLIGCGLAGILFLSFSQLFSSGKTEEKPVDTLSAEAFISQTEAKLEALIGSIEGAGQCHVMVTLENSVQRVYATEQRTNTDRQEDTDSDYSKRIERDDNEESVIVIDTQSGKEGLLVTEIQPTVKGVVVVCEGGDRKEVCDEIVKAVTVALDLSSKRVCVTKLS